MIATFLQHPSSPVQFDPPLNSVEAAIRANERERQEIVKAVQAREERDAGKLSLLSLVDTYGVDTVELWLRNIAASIRPLSPGTSSDPRR
jgi:hypothetical protein